MVSSTLVNTSVSLALLSVELPHFLLDLSGGLHGMLPVVLHLILSRKILMKILLVSLIHLG
jgi:hypothetical protein